MSKRLFDCACAGLGLMLLSPIFLVVALAVRLDSPGPVFFRQVRIGWQGKPFRIHKFRTMKVEQDRAASQITIGRDPRITRVGHILRKTKLDELPQLIDVIAGSMSLVGPRPEVPRYVDHYPDDLRRIVLSVRPGITDETSLKFIDEADLLAVADDPEEMYINRILPIKLRYHAEYVCNRTMMGDFGIIISTIFSMFRTGSISVQLDK